MNEVMLKALWLVKERLRVLDFEMQKGFALAIDLLFGLVWRDDWTGFI